MTICFLQFLESVRSIFFIFVRMTICHGGFIQISVLITNLDWESFSNSGLRANSAFKSAYHTCFASRSTCCISLALSKSLLPNVELIVHLMCFENTEVLLLSVFHPLNVSSLLVLAMILLHFIALGRVVTIVFLLLVVKLRIFCGEAQLLFIYC